MAQAMHPIAYEEGGGRREEGGRGRGGGGSKGERVGEGRVRREERGADHLRAE
jgi:hypothetical protein